MKHTYNKTTDIFKAGKYVIGDLCYLIDDDEWGNFLDEVEYGDTREITIDDNPSVKCFYDSTSYGDGGFLAEGMGASILQNNLIDYKLPVDAGIIGIVSAEILDNYGIELPDGLILVDFKTDFGVYCKNGDFNFGNVITVDTNPDTIESYSDF